MLACMFGGRRPIPSWRSPPPSFSSISKLAPSILIQLPPIKSNNFERMRSGEEKDDGGGRGLKIHIGLPLQRESWKMSYWFLPGQTQALYSCVWRAIMWKDVSDNCGARLRATHDKFGTHFPLDLRKEERESTFLPLPSSLLSFPCVWSQLRLPHVNRRQSNLIQLRLAAESTVSLNVQKKLNLSPPSADQVENVFQLCPVTHVVLRPGSWKHLFTWLTFPCNSVKPQSEAQTDPSFIGYKIDLQHLHCYECYPTIQRHKNL